MENDDHRAIWEAWHEASVERDIDRLISLYAEDAILEAPLIPAVMEQESGIVFGRAGILAFLNKARQKGASSVSHRVPMHWFRKDHLFSAGDTLIWEYPRETPDGDQMDIVEVMKIVSGLIVQHRVYWGWKITASLAEK